MAHPTELDALYALLVAAAVTALLTPLTMRLARRLGMIDEPRERGLSERPTPLLGGFAMYGGMAAGLLVASRIPALNSAFAETNMAKGLLLAGGLVVVMGFVDDRWGIGAISWVGSRYRIQARCGVQPERKSFSRW